MVREDISMNTLVSYIDGLIQNNVGYEVLIINLLTNELDKNLKETMKTVSNFILGYRFAIVFQNVGNEFTLIYRKDAYKLSSKFKTLQAQLSRIEEKMGISFSYLVVKDTEVFDSGEDFLYTIREYLETAVHDKLRKADSVCTFKKDDYDRLKEQQATKKMIEEALQEDRIEIFLQPIYSAAKKKFVSAEVLARIIDKDGTIIPPYKFIDVAERTGLISRVEDVVFEKACKFVQDYNLWDLGLEYIEINLSIIKGETQKLHEKYRIVLEKYNVEPSRINLEITETASISAKENLLKNMNTMIEEGIKFSLDDFGSGESNLNYIIEMPVSIVKFDKDMIQGYFTNPKAKTVILGMLGMLHSLNLKVVAEGVEEKEQLDEMLALGIDYIQGYYFSKPISKKDFVQFIRSYNE